MMSDDDSSSVHEKPRGNLKIIKAWVTTPNLLQRELLDRIADQATKYDLVRDGEFVHQCFGGGPMEPEVFRRQLQLAFHLKLTEAELAAAVRIFDKNKNGLIESDEFLKSFFEMGAAEKERRHRAQLERKRRAEERRKQEAARKEKDAHEKAARVVIKDFRQEDLDSAIAKVKQAAALYDRYHPSSVQLSAFEGQYMEPYIFKDQLRRCFGLRLSPQEFGALLHYFEDKERGGVVDCVEFLVTFFRTGFAEKAKQWIYRRDRELRKQEARLEEERKRKEEADAKNALKVSYEFTAEEEASALRKLTEAACRFDRNAAGCMGLDAFEGKDMPPHVFKEQLKMTFNIQVSPGELGALMKTFDKDKSGSVSTSEFLVDFFRRGFRQKNRTLKAAREKHAKKIQQRLAEEAAKKAEADSKNALQVTHEFGTDDFNSAVHKITEAAIRYDKYHPSSVPLTAFEGASLQPHEFKEQLRRVFNIHLSPRELGALMDLFDKDKDGTIACNEFLIMFFKTGFKERNRIRREWRRRQAKLDEARVAKAKADQEALDRKNAMKVNSDFAQGDFDSAIGKIIEAAVLYDRYHPSAVQLDAFEGSSMGPHIFKEQLRRVFNVKLSPKELGAVMSHFDKDGSGEIDCAEFLLEFFKLGFEERTRRIKLYRKKAALHAEKARREAELRAKKDLSKALGAASPFTEADLDSAAAKLIDTAAKYSRRNLGIIGLKAFEVGNLTPMEFQRQLRQTFYLELTPGEMGAVTAYFDRDRNGSISIAEFLAQFFRISNVAKAFAGKPDAKARWRKLKEEIKEQVVQRQYDFDNLKVDLSVTAPSDHRGSSSSGPETEGRPVHMHPQHQHAKRLPPATTPKSKLDRRFARAEAASRFIGGAVGLQGGGRVLDLSTYRQPRDGSDFCLTDLPRKALEFKGLRELWLANNSLTDLPGSWLGSLKQLRVLSLTGNKLSALPGPISELPLLERLYADHNLITEVPAPLLSACSLTLRELKLDHNRLAAFPPAIPTLRALEVLGLSHNQLTAVEGSSLCRGKMVRLEWLDLDGNDLPLLPAALATLAPNLRTLSAVGNARLDTNKAQSEAWSLFSKLQHLRLVAKRFVPRPLVMPMPQRPVSAPAASATAEQHDQSSPGSSSSPQHQQAASALLSSSAFFLGEQQIGSEAELGRMLHTVIKRRKLVSSNYIVRPKDV